MYKFSAVISGVCMFSCKFVGGENIKTGKEEAKLDKEIEEVGQQHFEGTWGACRVETVDEQQPQAPSNNKIDR